MQNSSFSKIVLVLLSISLFSQNILAADAAAGKPGKMAQLQATMKRFHAAVRSFARCAATGECKTEHQKKLAAEIGDLVKRLVLLVGTVAVIGTAAWFARDRLIKDLKTLKTEVRAEVENQEARADAMVRGTIWEFTPGVTEAVGKSVEAGVDYTKNAIGEVGGQLKKAVEGAKVVTPLGTASQVQFAEPATTASTVLNEKQSAESQMSEEKKQLLSKQVGGQTGASQKKPVKPQSTTTGQIEVPQEPAQQNPAPGAAATQPKQPQSWYSYFTGGE